MSYQNDLEVDSKSNQKGEKSYSLLLVAFLLVSAVAATACAGYSYGVKNGLSLSQTVTSLAVLPKFYTSRYYYIPGHQSPIANEVDEPNGNAKIKATIVSEDLFSLYSYLNTKKYSSTMATRGYGLSMKDGSPVPVSEDCQSTNPADCTDGKAPIFSIDANFFGNVVKTEYDPRTKAVVRKSIMGKMTGLNEEGNIILADGGSCVDGKTKTSRYGVVEVLCGLTEKMYDVHMHSECDVRITIHHPSACNKEVQQQFKNTIKNAKIAEEKEREAALGLSVKEHHESSKAVLKHADHLLERAGKEEDLFVDKLVKKTVRTSVDEDANNERHMAHMEKLNLMKHKESLKSTPPKNKPSKSPVMNHADSAVKTALDEKAHKVAKTAHKESKKALKAQKKQKFFRSEDHEEEEHKEKHLKKQKLFKSEDHEDEKPKKNSISAVTNGQRWMKAEGKME